MDERKTYSISVRLRRTITEEAFVSVPVNSEVIDPVPDQDGSHHIDGKKLTEVAVRMGTDSGVQWVAEGQSHVEVHPVQTRPPETS